MLISKIIDLFFFYKIFKPKTCKLHTAQMIINNWWLSLINNSKSRQIKLDIVEYDALLWYVC